MLKKIFIFWLISIIVSSQCIFIAVAVTPGGINIGNENIEYRNVTVFAPAVGATDDGYVGIISTITVTIQEKGSGRVFVDTLPLTQIDMQGSARLAVNVASTLVDRDESIDIDVTGYDYFFVVRTSAPIIGGPSAGAIMTLATIALLENWTIDEHMVMTGMINPDGGIGPIGGILEKIDAAAYVGATRFLIPMGQGIYTTTVTETINDNGWTRVVSRPVSYDVADYALDNYNIEVIEVADIHDVVLYATGNVFDIPESDVPILTDEYINSMTPLASSLLSEARSLYDEASDQLNLTKVPNYYPFYYLDQITDMFDSAYNDLIDSEVAYDEELFYSSTSNSFQSLINSRFVLYACGYFNSEDEQDFLLSVINDATKLHADQSQSAKSANIDGMISLQCVGAAQQRASDAETFLADAQTNYDSNDYLTALYKIAYAVERSNSVGWWLGIAAYYNETGSITDENLSSLAGEYIEESQQAVVYSGVILDEIGQTSSYLTAAEELLESARDNLEKDYPAAAFFESLEALVKANLALELVDGVSTEQLDRARENAENSISQSRSQDIEPVLAISYYEYGQSLTNESEYDLALVYYRLGDIIAGALEYTSSTGGISSRYIGIPERATYSWNLLPSGSIIFYIFFIIIGGVGGLGLGLIIGASITHRSEKDEYKKEWMPRSIDEYNKKH